MFNIDVLALSECTWGCPDTGKIGVSIPYQPNIEIMQYTGLKDKNGKEIYEGDIVEYNVDNKFIDIILVKWGKVEFSFLRKYKRFRNKGWQRTTYQGIDKYGKVIGNIYDNPELLESEGK